MLSGAVSKGARWPPNFWSEATPACSYSHAFTGGSQGLGAGSEQLDHQHAGGGARPWHLVEAYAVDEVLALQRQGLAVLQLGRPHVAGAVVDQRLVDGVLGG